MRGRKEHRIYSYMSAPLSFIGLTLDEWGAGIVFLIMSFALESITLKLTCAVLMPSSVYVIKKLKKLTSGFSLISFLHWRWGLRPGVSNCVPCSWKRRFFG
jgi:hypothetical protein